MDLRSEYMIKLNSTNNESLQSFNSFLTINFHFQHPTLTFLFPAHIHNSEFWGQEVTHIQFEYLVVVERGCNLALRVETIQLLTLRSSSFQLLSFWPFLSLVLRSWIRRANLLVKYPLLKNHRFVVIYVSDLRLVCAGGCC